MGKKEYRKVSVGEFEIARGRTILTGSITATPVSIPKESVTVSSFKEDKTFEDGGFGDISF